MEIPIIFIHIGNEFFPEYLHTAVFQARLWNPNNPIYVITQEKYCEKFSHFCQFIAIELLEISDTRKYFLENSKIDLEFRQGFWRYSTERILILADFMKQYNIKQCLHLENDNMLYSSLQDLVAYFNDSIPLYATSMYNNWILFNFFIVNNLDALYKLADFLAHNEDKHKSEMQLGYEFYMENKDLVHILPGYPGLPTISSEFVFDAAAFGQYFGGIDPRNGLSAPGFVNPDAAFKVNTFLYKYVRQGGLLCIQAKTHENNSWKKIVVLHIHSKYLENFVSTRREFMALPGVFE